MLSCLQRLRDWARECREALGELLRKYHHQSIFRIFLASYLIVLVIPLIMGCICYIKALAVVAEESAKYNRAMLEQARQAIDNQIEAINQLSVDISREPSIQGLMHETDLQEPRIIYQMVAVTGDISDVEGLNPFLDNIYIYFRNSDIILNHSAKYSPEFFYESQNPYEGISYPQWKKLLNSYHYRDFQPAQTIRDSNGASRRAITYMCSLPLEARQSRLATLVVLINEEKIRDLLTNIETLNQGALYVLDQNDRVLTSLGSGSGQFVGSFGELLPGTDKLSRKLDGRKMVVSQIESDYSGWKYVAIIPTKVFMGKVNYIRTLTISVFVFSLLVGLLMAYILAVRNYRPLQTMVNNMSTKLSIDLPQQGNEYDSMQRIFDNLVSRSNKFKDALDGHVQVLKYYYPIDIENRLIKSVQTGYIVEVERILNTIFDKNLARGQMSLDMARCLFFDIVCTAIKVVNGMDGELLLQNDFNPVGFLAECGTITEMQVTTLGIYEKLCNYINDNNQKRHHKKIIENIQEYVDQNYQDTNLGLSAIAEALSLTPSYVSRFFNERTNQSIVDYINKIRIARAKQLLKDSSLLIYDVATRVGYSSDDALIKAFRKYEGVTPGRFREVIANCDL